MDPCRTWCPSSSCQAVCQLKEADSARPQLVRCGNCTLEFCSACKASWHPGQECQENPPITAFLPGESRYRLRSQSSSASVSQLSVFLREPQCKSFWHCVDTQFECSCECTDNDHTRVLCFSFRHKSKYILVHRNESNAAELFTVLKKKQSVLSDSSFFFLTNHCFL